jgi:hypothetical protein
MVLQITQLNFNAKLADFLFMGILITKHLHEQIFTEYKLLNSIVLNAVIYCTH